LSVGRTIESCIYLAGQLPAASIILCISVKTAQIMAPARCYFVDL